MIVASSIQNIAVMAGWSSVATMAGVMVLAGMEGKPALVPVQAISHIAFGEGVIHAPKHTGLQFVVGLILNGMAMVGWSAVAEVLFQASGIATPDIGSTLIIAISITMIAFVVDFHVVPKRFTPGFEQILSRRSLLIVYGFLAAALFIGGMQRHLS